MKASGAGASGAAACGRSFDSVSRDHRGRRTEPAIGESLGAARAVGAGPARPDADATHSRPFQGDGDLVPAAQALRRRSARRAAVCGDRAAVFRDPAWDMLLEAFISGATGAPVPVKVMCAASGVPTTTALRWISVMEANGLLCKAPNLADRRSTLLRLTEWARCAMAEYLRGATRA